jgi:ABC-type lipoprotein export system ATPase subunit
VQVELTNLDKTYRDSRGQPVRALRGVSLRIAPGEFVAVMGSSGSGKSTLLNIIGLLDRPDGGSCRLDGEEVVDWPESRRALFRNRRIGFIFQSFHLLPFLNIRENVELPFLYSRDGGTGPGDLSRLLASVELQGMEHRFPGELSGGQQQRVAIARALALGADLLLADEPTGNLDATTAEAILSVFASLSNSGRTVVLVTHDPRVAAKASRRVDMSEGRIVTDTAAAPAEPLGGRA